MSEMLVVPLLLIRENPVALRGVDKTLEKYLGLVDSIKEQGVIKPIALQKKTDEETGEQYYILIDGLQRFSAAGDAGIEDK